jgi:hypothetical protein
MRTFRSDKDRPRTDDEQAQLLAPLPHHRLRGPVGCGPPAREVPCSAALVTQSRSQPAGVFVHEKAPSEKKEAYEGRWTTRCCEIEHIWGKIEKSQNGSGV